MVAPTLPVGPWPGAAETPWPLPTVQIPQELPRNLEAPHCGACELGWGWGTPPCHREARGAGDSISPGGKAVSPAPWPWGQGLGGGGAQNTGAGAMLTDGLLPRRAGDAGQGLGGEVKSRRGHTGASLDALLALFSVFTADQR